MDQNLTPSQWKQKFKTYVKKNYQLPSDKIPDDYNILQNLVLKFKKKKTKKKAAAPPAAPKQAVQPAARATKDKKSVKNPNKNPTNTREYKVCNVATNDKDYEYVEDPKNRRSCKLVKKCKGDHLAHFENSKHQLQCMYNSDDRGKIRAEKRNEYRRNQTAKKRAARVQQPLPNRQPNQQQQANRQPNRQQQANRQPDVWKKKYMDDFHRAARDIEKKTKNKFRMNFDKNQRFEKIVSAATHKNLIHDIFGSAEAAAVKPVVERVAVNPVGETAQAAAVNPVGEPTAAAVGETAAAVGEPTLVGETAAATAKQVGETAAAAVVGETAAVGEPVVEPVAAGDEADENDADEVKPPSNEPETEYLTDKSYYESWDDKEKSPANWNDVTQVTDKGKTLDTIHRVHRGMRKKSQFKNKNEWLRYNKKLREKIDNTLLSHEYDERERDDDRYLDALAQQNEDEEDQTGGKNTLRKRRKTYKKVLAKKSFNIYPYFSKYDKTVLPLSEKKSNSKKK
jgi:hypothetical protein